MKNQKGISTIAGITIFVVVAVFAFGGVFAFEYYLQKNEQKIEADQNQNLNNNTQPVACTMEAKICPDGSSVGRSGPNCEFAECPEVVDQTAGWKTFDSGDGFEFKYPVINSFITFNEPGIIRSNSDINGDGCYLGHENNLISPNPVLEIGKITINNINFCVSQTSDSAMGHSYPVYLYTTTYKNAPENHFTIILPFSVTACDNFKGGSNYQLCVAFFSNPDNSADRIAQSIISTFKFY
jgi:hypothetical protein